MASIPGIHRQPTLQTLPGRITQMLHHLGRRHRRGEIQLHRTLSFLKTEHTKIFPFGLQENVRSPVERLAQQYTQSRITQIDGCTRKYSGALSCTHERNIGYFALMWHSDVPRNRIFVFLCAVVARKLWEFGRLGICAMPRHCKNSECARLCTYLDRCVYACGCG